MRMVVTALVLLVALVNLAPVVGVLSPDRLEALYGIRIEDPNLLVLMRHRAVLFGIVGGLLVGAALRPRLRSIGIAAGLVSMLSFVVVAALAGDVNDQLRRVAVIDLVASAILVAAALGARVLDRGMASASDT